MSEFKEDYGPIWLATECREAYTLSAVAGGAGIAAVKLAILSTENITNLYDGGGAGIGVILTGKLAVASARLAKRKVSFVSDTLKELEL